MVFLHCAFCFSWLLILDSLTSAVFANFKIFIMLPWGWQMDYVAGGLERRLTPGTNLTSSLSGKKWGKKGNYRFSLHYCYFRSCIKPSHLPTWAQPCSWALFPKGNWSTPLPWGVCSLQPKDELSPGCSSGAGKSQWHLEYSAGNSMKHPNCNSPAFDDSRFGELPSKHPVRVYI